LGAQPPFPANPPSSACSSLVSHYRLDEAGGNIVSDSLNLNNGTSTAYVTTTDQKLGSGARTFNGNGGDYITIPDNDTLTPANISVGFWAKLNSTSSSMSISKFDNSTYANESWEFMYRGAGNNDLVLQIQTGTTASTTGLWTASNTPDTNWHYFVATWDGTTAKIYKDGVALTTTKTGGTPSGALYNNTTALVIGNRTTLDLPSSGTIDEISIWSKAIAQSDIAKMYNCGGGLAFPFSIDVSCSSFIGASASYKRVFVTNTSHRGDMGGLRGADSICQAQATNAGLGGTWRAWLSDSAFGSAGNRLTHSTVPYKTLDGTQIANDWSDLTDGSITAAINVNSSGNKVTTNTWTGTESTGESTAENQCQNWSYDGGGSDFGGAVGGTAQTDTNWTKYQSAACSTQLPIYCIEQEATANPLASGLVSYWGADESNNLSFVDSAGTNNASAIAGTMPGPGIAGKSRLFYKQNLNDSITVPDAANLRPANISLQAWVTGYDVVNYGGIIMKTTANTWNDGYGLYFDPTTNSLCMYINNFSTYHACTPYSPTTNWTHVVGTFDGSKVRLYINGVKKDEQPAAITLTHSTSPLLIGQSQGSGAGYHWDGKIDEVALWNRALADGEVAQLYNCGKANPYPFATVPVNVCSGVVAYWKMDETSGTSIIDSVGNNYGNSFPSSSQLYANPTSNAAFTVPNGVTSITTKLWASGGGGGDAACGGAAGTGGGGGFALSTLPVSAGESLTIKLGDAGSPPSAACGGGGGGGYTGIFRGTTALLVAGGGGGGATAAEGGPGGGFNGVQGRYYGDLAGGGGTQIQGGAPGKKQDPQQAVGGTTFQGGNGGGYGATTSGGAGGLGAGSGGGLSPVRGGGGGGGGYFGGGGGAAGLSNGSSFAGGGGGSGFLGGFANFYIHGFGILSAVETFDPDYLATTGKGGAANSSGSRGRIALNWTATPNVTTTSQLIGKAARTFDGSTNYIEIPRNLSLQFGSGDMSIGAWIKTSDASTFASPGGYVAGHYINISTPSEQDGYAIWVSPAGKGICGFANTASVGASVSGTTNVNDGAWHFLVCTRSGTTVTLYVDGKSEGAPAALTGSTNNSGFFTIGRANTNLAQKNYFKGSIDEVGVWNRSLSVDEINHVYNCRTGLQYPFNSAALCANLNAYWKMDETSGATVADSVNNNNGTANSARQSYTTPSTSTSFVVPAGVTDLLVKAWGAGGGGGSRAATALLSNIVSYWKMDETSGKTVTDSVVASANTGTSSAGGPGTKQTYAAPSSSITYTVPAGVTSLSAKAWGAGGGGGSTNPTTLTNNLVSFWRFEDTVTDGATNQTFADQVGGNTLTTGNSTTTQATGPTGQGKARTFANSVALNSTANNLEPLTSSFSATAWFKTTSNNSRVIVGKRNAGASGWYIYVSAASNVYATLQDTTGVTVNLTSNAVGALDGTWKQVTLVVDRTNNTAQLYINGAASGAAVSTAGLGTVFGGTAFAVGMTGNSATAYRFDGDIDEVGYWNRPLNTTEVSQLYSCGSPYSASCTSSYVMNGGGGGFAQATIPVTPNETLTIRVGGGGNSGTSGGGGGYSGIFRGSTPLLVAGGGGGAGFYSNTFAGGAGGGTNGANGTGMTPGFGGTQSAGGAGNTSIYTGGSGSSLQGGNGYPCFAGSGTGGTNGGGNGPGGGGGGYFGGGAGGCNTTSENGAGGGGSGYTIDPSGTKTTGSGATPANTTDADYQTSVGVGSTSAGPSGNGLVVLTPTAGDNISTTDKQLGTASRTFNGNGEYIDLGTPASLNLGNTFTVSAWVKPDSARDHAGVVSKTVANRDGSAYSFLLTTHSDGSISSYSNASGWQYSNPNVITLNAWSHAVWVVNGGRMYFYVNGTPQGSVPFTYTDVDAHNVFIGSWYSSFGMDFSGKIDDVGIWKKALSLDEINQIYNCGTGSQYNFATGSCTLTGGAGGGGGFAQATIPVTPNETLTIRVGGGGTGAGTGGGGGYSGIFRGNTPLLIAGAGGGGSSISTYPGGAGGGTVGNAGGGGTRAGGGGGQSTGGTAGTPSSGIVSTAGSSLTGGIGGGGTGAGGTGGTNGGAKGGGGGGGDEGGGGGGGGYFGGGGGVGCTGCNNPGGGGGGSSYTTGSSVSTFAGSGQNAANTNDSEWQAGVGIGGNAATTGGNGLVTTSYGNSITTTDQKLGTAARTFSSSTDGIFVTSNPFLVLKTAMTVAGWVKTSDTGAGKFLFGKVGGGSGETAEYAVTMNAGIPRVIVFNSSGNSYLLAAATSNIADGKWHLVAGVFNTTPPGMAQIFIDGVLQTTSFNVTSTLASVGAAKFGIGQRSDTLAGPPIGTMDEVGLWSRALTPNEIRALYNCGNGNQYPFSSSVPCGGTTYATPAAASPTPGASTAPTTPPTPTNGPLPTATPIPAGPACYCTWYCWDGPVGFGDLACCQTSCGL
jgi:hypothetical protein